MLHLHQNLFLSKQCRLCTQTINTDTVTTTATSVRSLMQTEQYANTPTISLNKNRFIITTEVSQVSIKLTISNKKTINSLVVFLSCWLPILNNKTTKPQSNIDVLIFSTTVGTEGLFSLQKLSKIIAYYEKERKKMFIDKVTWLEVPCFVCLVFAIGNCQFSRCTRREISLWDGGFCCNWQSDINWVETKKQICNV